MLDVGALLEDAENRGGVLDELQEHNIQVRQELERLSLGAAPGGMLKKINVNAASPVCCSAAEYPVSGDREPDHRQDI